MENDSHWFCHRQNRTLIKMSPHTTRSIKSGFARTSPESASKPNEPNATLEALKGSAPEELIAAATEECSCRLGCCRGSGGNGVALRANKDDVWRAITAGSSLAEDQLLK